ncbi:hypothetical protein F5B21DRAFT_299642 [Xylaria acuta]|nr:hypothetical protein F5B21DRAFT_299642 [Xylaria acuta]
MAQATLLLVPREIRDLIYHFTFAGSRLHFGSGFMNVRCRWHVVGHVELLFACNRCYEEGRSAFWDEVIVHGYERWPSTTIYELSQNLGDFAKSRIRHIRCIRAVRDTEENKLGLGQFPRLKTCEIFGWPVIFGAPCSEFGNDDEQSWVDFAASRQFPGADPHRALEEYWKLDVKQYKVEFLMRFTVVRINSYIPYRTNPKVSKMRLSALAVTLNRCHLTQMSENLVKYDYEEVLYEVLSRCRNTRGGRRKLPTRTCRKS